MDNAKKILTCLLKKSGKFINWTAINTPIRNLIPHLNHSWCAGPACKSLGPVVLRDGL